MILNDGSRGAFRAGRDAYAGENERPADDREHRERLAEENPRERRGHHRLREQRDGGERARQVRERVGDETLADDVGNSREPREQQPAVRRQRQKPLA